MIYSGLSQPASTQPPTKIAKKQYAAGFRNYHPPNKQSISNSQCSTTQDDPNDIFHQLRIGNLKQLYLSSLPPPADHRKEREQKQQQAVLRLTMKEKKTEPEADEGQERVEAEKAEQQREKFLNTYHLEANYEPRANLKLYYSQYRQVRQRLKELFRKKRAKKGDFDTVDAALIGFLLSQQEFLTRDKSQDQMELQFANFINRKAEKQVTGTINKDSLQNIVNGSVFWYGFIDIHKETDSIFDSQTLLKMIRSDAEVQGMQESVTMTNLLHKKYTVPYETSLYSIKKQSNNQTIAVEQEPTEKHTYQARKVPKTTYQQPKQRPKSSFSKTQAQPFNLTQTQPLQTMQDLYNWDRSFKANPIPQSTYKGPAQTGDKQFYRKQRAKQLMQSAAYPSSMAYMQHYGEHQQKRQEQLKNKHQKVWSIPEESHQIPNFQVLHRMDQVALQERIVVNQKNTKCVPFNLSQPKPKKEPIYEMPIPMTTQMKKKTMSKLPQANSTLKFEALVAKRKRDQQQKEEKVEKRQKKQQRKKKQNSPLKQMLKQRLDDEVLSRPRPQQYPQDLSTNSVKVNLEEIYSSQPLLIQRQGSKKEPLPKNWKPVI